MFVNVYLWYNSWKCQDHICCDLNVSGVLLPPPPPPTKHCLESICLMPLYYTLFCVQSWKVEVKRKFTCYQQLHSNENTATFTPPPPPAPLLLLVYGPVAFTINMHQCQCLSLSLTHATEADPAGSLDDQVHSQAILDAVLLQVVWVLQDLPRKDQTQLLHRGPKPSRHFLFQLKTHPKQHHQCARLYCQNTFKPSSPVCQNTFR